VALAVPCVDCGRPLAVMARTGGPEYLVELPAHEGPAGAACPGSGALCVVPPPAGRESVALALEGLERAEESAPAVEAPAPAAPPSSEALPERMRGYFRACPLSALLRIHRDLEAAAERALELVALFEGPSVGDLLDPYHAPLEGLRSELEGVLTDRAPPRPRRRSRGGRPVHVPGRCRARAVPSAADGHPGGGAPLRPLRPRGGPAGPP